MKINEKEQAVFERFQEYGKNAKLWMNKCVLMLPEISRKRIWEKKGFGSIYEFAAKLAGMSRNKVNEGLRILEKIKDMPEIKEVVEKKGIWAAKPVVRVATVENQKFWAEKASAMSQSTLATYVKDVVEEEKKSNENGRLKAVKNDDTALSKPNLFQEIDDSTNKKTTISMKLKPETAEKLQKVKGKDDWDELMEEFIKFKEEKERKFQKELEKEKPKTVKSASHYVPAKISKYVRRRAKNKCESPNCTKTGKQLHHTIPFSLKKEHNPDKIRLLCEQHHDIAHHGLVKNEENQPQKWKTLQSPDLMDLKSVINDKIAGFRPH